MSRLAGQRVYLSGAMDAPEALGGVEWRSYITPILQKMGIGVFNPCDKPILYNDFPETPEMRELILKLKKDGKFEEVVEYYKQIVHEDLRGVDNCDFVICYLDIYQFPCGTYDEIYMAAGQRKPVLIVCPHGKENVPNWLWGRLRHELFFSSFDDMLQYLSRLDSGKESDLNRWVFFDYNKMFGVSK